MTEASRLAVEVLALVPVLDATLSANERDGSFPGGVCCSITRWRKERP